MENIRFYSHPVFVKQYFFFFPSQRTLTGEFLGYLLCAVKYVNSYVEKYRDFVIVPLVTIVNFKN